MRRTVVEIAAPAKKAAIRRMRLLGFEVATTNATATGPMKIGEIFVSTPKASAAPAHASLPDSNRIKASNIENATMTSSAPCPATSSITNGLSHQPMKAERPLVGSHVRRRAAGWRPI
jgi:hypothetical protein